MSDRGRRDRALLGLSAFLALVFLGYVASRPTGRVDVQLLLDLSVAGVAVGGIFALAGLGLVLTYKATGIFNFAYGALGAFVAYLLWQLHSGWGVPIGIAAPLALLVLGPALGVLLERAVFRPLEARGASVAEELVATVGVYVVLIGLAFTIWTGRTREPVQLFPADAITVTLPFTSDGQQLVMRIGTDQIGVVVLALVLSIALYLLFRFTSLGTRIRAVVDRRELAELSAIDANRVAAIAWAMGAGFAGITGVLLAPLTFGLDPVRLPLVVIETFAVAVIARLVSLPVAVGGGLFLGLATSYASTFSFATLAAMVSIGDETAARIGNAFDPALTSLAVFVLLGALLVMRKRQDMGEGEHGSLVARATVVGRSQPRLARRVAAVVILAFVALPLVLHTGTYGFAHRMLGLAMVMLSIVAVTGFSGHITLGQAGFAGLGALLTARLHAGTVLGLPELPVIPAMLVAGSLCVPVGLLAAWPALRRRGLYLGLTTLAIGLALSRYVFQNVYFNAPSVLDTARPGLFSGDTAFYYFGLAVLGLGVAITHNLRRGRLGRILAAMRDSETAAQSVGIGLRRYKLFIFSVGAFLAGVGGSLITQGAGAFSDESYAAFLSLLWFAAAYVAGITSIYGALLAAAILTLLQAYLDVPGLGFFLIGLAAVLLGQLPGGLVGLVRRATVTGWAPAGLRAAYTQAMARPTPVTRMRLTPFATRVLGGSATDDGHPSRIAGVGRPGQEAP